MYIRTKTISGQRYYYLVEGRWKNGKSMQKVLKYLGKSISSDLIVKLEKRFGERITNRFGAEI